jgi:alkylation response protein AidB-like acyl-CoA dehydrogenase
MNHLQLQKQQLDFQLRAIAGLPALLQSDRWSHIDEQTSDMILEQAVRLAAEKLAPLAASGDHAGCTLDQGRVHLPAGTRQTWEDWCELGFPMLALALEKDGMDLPLSLQCAIQELCDGTNMAFGMLAINQRCAIAALSSAFIPPESKSMIDAWLPRLGSGEITSTIAISEPQAGSDVGRILTSARQEQDGSWLLNGSKIWISYGDHDATDQILHLMLARVPNGETGTRGLGLFAVPRLLDEDESKANGITVLRLEEKMGLHASPTCVLDIRDARGWLIGEPGKGLQALFVMMNGMRLAVSVQGAAIASAAALHALAYANERPQGGRPDSKAVMICEHADVRRMLLEMIADSELARAFSLRTACLLDQAAQGGEAAADLLALAELMLPMAKTLGAETGFRTANTGIQVLGGYGYTRDYPLERMARDIRVSAIYEGTSGIQALDLLHRKILKNESVVLNRLLALIEEDLTDGDSPFADALPGLRQIHTRTLQQFSSGNASNEGAYAFLQLTGLLIHCWNGHALCCHADPTRAQEGRLKAALEYFASGLPAIAQYWADRCMARLPDCDLGN